MMKRILLALMLSIVTLGLNAQTPEEAEKINKWIDIYTNLNNAKNWTEMVAKAPECKAEVPNWDYVHYYSGIANYNLNNFDNALKDLTTFIGINQTEAGAYLLRGHIFSEKKDVQNAIADYNVYLEKNPSDNAAMLAKANAYLNANDLNGYVKELGVVLEKDPNNAVILENRASAYANLNNWQGAIDDYNKLIALDPNKADYYNNRAYANYVLKTPETYQLAIADYNKVVELGSGNEAVYSALTVLNGAIKDYKAEIKAWDKLIELKPDDIDNVYRRGTAKYNDKNYKGAIADFDIVIKDNPKHINALKRRATSKTRAGDKVGAQADGKLIRELEATGK